MTVNDIKSMLDRYYGGYTTEAEEKALLDYFSQNEVDEELLPDIFQFSSPYFTS